ncbi:MAG: NAD(+)/NADH kinase [Alistipes sp.]|nr:NAD(+)/NADH kinase [Alistipes sp.]
MNIILFSRKQLNHRKEQLETMLHAIERLGLNYTINEDFAMVIESLLGRHIPAERIFSERITGSGDDVVVTYGGDGTLLDAATLLDDSTIPVVGINCGRLGYLTADDGKGIAALFERIASRSLEFEHRAMLAVEGDIPAALTALNEVTIHRHGATMISVDTLINDKPVATYHGDGLIVATPTGSTAYSLSAGGPVLDPMCRCFTLSPLAPHNLTMRPVVIPDNSIVRLRVHTRSGEAFLSADNRTFSLKDGAEVTLRRASRELILAVPHNNTFYDTLREKMMWGVDKR